MAENINQDIVITRIVDAPVETLWESWTNPDHVKKWWGPRDFSSPYASIDLKEGGKYVFGMRAPEYLGGQDSYSGGIYTKVVPMERLEFTQAITDKDGNVIDPSEIGMPEGFPKEMHMTVIFKAIKDGTMTELTIIERGRPMDQSVVFALVGLYQQMDKLTESVQ